ncbi:MAG: hypothetical protein ACP5RF_03655 [Candidatus Micrarchaeia archaeon]
MNSNKAIPYVSVVVLIIIIVAFMVLVESGSKSINQQATTVPQTTIVNSSPLPLSNVLMVYAKNMSLVTALSINYNLTYYPIIGITPYSPVFNKSMAFYKSGNSSALSISAFTSSEKAYYYTNKNSSISCTSQSPFYNFSCTSVNQNPAVPIYQYIGNLYSMLNATALSYIGSRNVAGIQCNEYDASENGTAYIQTCIDPMNGYPLYINNTSLGFSMIAKSVSNNINSTSLIPLYSFGVINIICYSRKIDMNIGPFYNLNNATLIINATSIDNPSNIPAAHAFAYMPRLNAGVNLLISANWNSSISGKYLVKACSGAVCQSAVVSCS